MSPRQPSRTAPDPGSSLEPVRGAARAFRLDPEVVFREVDGEAVLLHLGSGRYFGLDAVGTEVWRALAAGEPVADAEARLLERYEVAPETLARDVDAFLEELARHGLVERVERGAP